MEPILRFHYDEDRAFFTRLCCADGEPLERYAALFDFHSVLVKRAAFKRLRGQVLPVLFQRDKGRCQLGYADRCVGREELALDVVQLDHLIPLATNELHKLLRGLMPEPGRKVPAQTLGSNHPANLVIACRACNAHKKHRLLRADQMQCLLARVELA